MAIANAPARTDRAARPPHIAKLKRSFPAQREDRDLVVRRRVVDGDYLLVRPGKVVTLLLRKVEAAIDAKRAA